MKRSFIFLLLTVSALWLTACSDGNTTSGVQEMSPPGGLIPPVIDLQPNVLAQKQAGSLAVVSPNGNENWLTGYEYVIKWNPGTATGTIRIYLYKSSDQYLTIDDVANTGTYRWEIPSTIPAHSEYQVGVQSWTNADNYDFSNRYFTIQPGLASSSSVYSNYVSSYGDLLTAYNSTGGGQSIDSWGKWHWMNHGLAEGRSLSEISTSVTSNTSSSSSSNIYEDYVRNYSDLLTAYNASGNSLSMGDWGSSHWTSYGSAEGRSLNTTPTSGGGYYGGGGTIGNYGGTIGTSYTNPYSGTTTYSNAYGGTIGTANTNAYSGTTTYSNAYGGTIGTANTNAYSGTTTYSNAYGGTIGTANTNAYSGTTTYSNAYGGTIGTSYTNPYSGTTTYSNAYGGTIGTSYTNPYSGTTTYSNAYGGTIGTSYSGW